MCYDMLGVIAHSRGDFAHAEQHFEKAVGLNPNYTEAQLNLMVTYNDLGKYDSAREIYAKHQEPRRRGRTGRSLRQGQDRQHARRRQSGVPGRRHGLPGDRRAREAR